MNPPPVAPQGKRLGIVKGGAVGAVEGCLGVQGGGSQAVDHQNRSHAVKQAGGLTEYQHVVGWGLYEPPDVLVVDAILAHHELMRPTAIPQALQLQINGVTLDTAGVFLA
ncbi:MAG: hypothetical protein K0U66_07465 [Gammaproteobacteria bacterium]|nr:hypothetical protein [Gammaproteobacteria bacterium]